MIKLLVFLCLFQQPDMAEKLTRLFERKVSKVKIDAVYADDLELKINDEDVIAITYNKNIHEITLITTGDPMFRRYKASTSQHARLMAVYGVVKRIETIQERQKREHLAKVIDKL